MDTSYSVEDNVQILVALMKAHGVRKIVVSPGTTNICFVASVQQDSFFELYSSADERSAAYMACGLAAESNEPVALSCTGATASRNYIPALTEAYYSKLPVLAITATQFTGKVGHNVPQVIDRSVLPNDIARLSVQIPGVHSKEDRWSCEVKINQALLELRRAGGGPVHINLTTSYSRDFSVKELPKTRVINRICFGDELPEMPFGNIVIFVGAHRRWTTELTAAVDDFCEKYNSVVICDQTSNYRGKYRVLASMVCAQSQHLDSCISPDLMIDMGNISGSYLSIYPKQVWRVNPDGEIRDTYFKLRYIFEMEEKSFFEAYSRKNQDSTAGNSYLQIWRGEQERLLSEIPDLPYSNIWIAQNSASRLPENSVLYLGILNTLRSWNFFETPDTVAVYSNTGGFGIDGGVSTLLGASLACKDRLYFGVVGDLGFFYEMNVLGNRHVGPNIRIMLINNGCGTEFKNYNHFAAKFGEDANDYMAAMGHYGQQSKDLVRHYAEDLGYEYMSASNKEEYLANVERFFTPHLTEKPMVFEIFTDHKDESDAIRTINHLEVSTHQGVKEIVKNVVGDKGVQTIKKILRK